MNDLLHEDILILLVTQGLATMGDWIILSKFAENAERKVELGTAFGFSTMVLSLHKGVVYTIDNHEAYTKQGLYTPKEKSNIIKNYLELYGKNNINVIRDDSQLAANRFTDNEIDLLFIDAGHDYESVKKDYLAWYPKLKKDGVILFHDVNEMTTGVWKFYNNDLQKEIKSGRLRELIQDIKYKTDIKVYVKDRD